MSVNELLGKVRSKEDDVRMVFCEMCGIEIEPGEDVFSKGRIACKACAGVVESGVEEPVEEEKIEEE